MRGLVTLDELAKTVEGERLNWIANMKVQGIHHDSRLVQKNDVFVALRGEQSDGHDFIEAAIENGAIAIIVEKKTEHSVPQLICKNTRLIFSRLSEIVYGNPTSSLRVVGITGTNGKSTVSWIIHEALQYLGMAVSSLGTISNRTLHSSVESSLTTPEGDEISRVAQQTLKQKGTHLIMEVSSHALAQHRMDGISLDVGVFTNLTQDHFDYHDGFQAYAAAKKRLFFDLLPKFSVLNIDDPVGKDWAKQLMDSKKSQVLTCSLEKTTQSDFCVKNFNISLEGIEANVQTPDGLLQINSPLIGEHNLQNIVFALASMHALGLPIQKSISAITQVDQIPGRLEKIESLPGTSVFVDYAHTPDGLQKVLSSLRSMTLGKLWVVFGCGGNRDQKKRPLMGAEASRWADVLVVTSDNPRDENPETIIAQIVAGFQSSKMRAIEMEQLTDVKKGFMVEPDRAKAIAVACENLSSGDTLLIAGKGHETYQIMGTQRLPFDDRKVAKDSIQPMLASM